MSTFDVHLSADPGSLTVEACDVRAAILTRHGITTALSAYELVDADGAVVLAVPLDSLVAIKKRDDEAADS